MQYLWIGLGGFLGANARYLVQQWAASQWGAMFPYGTMIANVAGSFIIALFLTLVARGLAISPHVVLFIATGFLGGFTTFSSFSMDLFLLFERGGWQPAAINFLGNTILGILGVLLGVGLGRWLVLEIYS